MAVIGIYEKALPKAISWEERFALVKKLGFDFMELSIDESEERLARLDWSEKEITTIRETLLASEIRIHSICLSGHRKYPFGSSDKKKQLEARRIMKKTIQLAHKLSIPIIQLAGYDVYYEEKTVQSRELFIEGLRESVKEASKYGVTLAIETMDDPFLNSITKFLSIKKQVRSPYLQVYPDVGNLSAWLDNRAAEELEKGIESISAIHLKDTYPVTELSEGQFRNVPFGKGCVDFTGLFQVLKRLDYDGAFLIEMWNEEDNNFEEKIREAQQYIYPKLREVGYDVH